MIKEYDYLFKLVIIGDSGVGKSSLLLRFSDDQFNESYLTTIGVDFRFRTLPIESKTVKLQIWDTAGQERFRTITSAYYKGADGIVMVYDVGQKASFENMDKYWVNEIESYAGSGVEVMMLGNKSDTDDSSRQVSYEEAENYAQKKNYRFFETSAKTSLKVNEAFIALAKSLISKKGPTGVANASTRANSQDSQNPQRQQKLSDKNAAKKDRNSQCC